MFKEGYSRSFRSDNIVGYMGSLDNRLDYDLICHLVEQNPKLTFEFVGRIVDQKAVDRLRQYENTMVIGPRPYHTLPQIIKKWKVALIPFTKNEFTKNIYPLKINEYLAAGLPVVSTAFGDLSDFVTCIQIAGTKDVFDLKLKALVCEDSPERENYRIQFAKQNDWNQRAEKFQKLIA